MYESSNNCTFSQALDMLSLLTLAIWIGVWWHLPSWSTALSWWKGLCNSVKVWAMLCRATQDGWVTVVHWRRTLPLTPVFLSGEPHRQYKKTKRHDNGRWTPPGWKVSSMLLGKSRGQLQIVLERMKWLGQSRSNTRLCLMVKVKPDAVKNNIA